ncbi:ATP-binding protein [Xinfangfangia sp. D13-10-4-6]|uniref:YncE family protein n=1 Tax=Pseudogemmobacter hezensis TaxID=2737662 RepID=UPI00155445BC|nr:YncE family protein [Pseudogemmobacter hezensis]NPD16778.1 ATP-binding protein [Pseudogemmobacter hezensis]
MKSTGLKRSLLTTLCIAALSIPSLSLAEAAFPAPVEFKGRIRAESAVPGVPVHAGGEVRISATGLAPGQKLVLQRGPDVLSDAALQADEKGSASLTFTLPADAAPGLHPLVVLLEEPSMTTTIDLKISKPLDYLNEKDWSVAAVHPAKGLYQSAYSARSNALFVTAADFSGGTSELLRLDPETLEVQARITPADFPEDQKPPAKEGAPKGPYKLAPAGVFGLGLDEAEGRIWVTNTPDNTIAVYAQDDLSLIHQFAPGAVYHSRDVLIDPLRKRAFVSSSATSNVYVFDSESYEPLGVIDIRSAQRGGEFYVMSLAIDPARAEVYVVSRISNELAIIDAASLEVKKILALPGAKNATGLDVDPATGRLFVAAQDSNTLLILDRDSGEILHDVTVGAGALNVVYDATSGLAWVSSREAGSLTAVNNDGEIVAHLEGGSYANHVAIDGKGAVFAVNKSLGAEDEKADFLRRITRAD